MTAAPWLSPLQSWLLVIFLVAFAFFVCGLIAAASLRPPRPRRRRIGSVSTCTCFGGVFDQDCPTHGQRGAVA